VLSYETKKGKVVAGGNTDNTDMFDYFFRSYRDYSTNALVNLNPFFEHWTAQSSSTLSQNRIMSANLDDEECEILDFTIDRSSAHHKFEARS